MSEDDLPLQIFPDPRELEEVDGDVTLVPAEPPSRRASEQQSFVTVRVVSGKDVYRVCTVYEGERVVCGRDRGCDLVCSDSSVSRHHLSVMVRSDGVYIDDLGSSNGTLYRGMSVSHPTRVEIGSEIQLGRVLIRLERLSMDELSGLARLRARLQETDRDPLCDVPSRQFMEEVLPVQLRGYSEAKIVVSACLIDVDGFEQINEALGRNGGDRVLRQIAVLLEESLRQTDDVFRFGGDEFLLVLPHCGVDAAYELADRIREKVEKHDWAKRVESPSAPFRVTVSAGVAEYAGEGMTDWLARADRALYDAKAAGRNQTRRASSTPAS